MTRLLKNTLNKEDYKKVILIKKYAKIRFKRFWREWGITKQEFIDFMGVLAVFAVLAVLYIIGCVF